MFFLLFSNNGMNNGQLSSAISWHREQSASIENNQHFVVRTILPWQWMEITLFIACVYLVVMQIQGGTILLLVQQLIMIVGLKVTWLHVQGFFL